MNPLEQILKEFDEQFPTLFSLTGLKSSETMEQKEKVKNFLKASLTRFARSIVEQSVPEECSCFENALAGHRCEFNACRSHTLSNADNLLK